MIGPTKITISQLRILTSLSQGYLLGRLISPKRWPIVWGKLRKRILNYKSRLVNLKFHWLARLRIRPSIRTKLTHNKIKCKAYQHLSWPRSKVTLMLSRLRPSVRKLIPCQEWNKLTRQGLIFLNLIYSSISKLVTQEYLKDKVNSKRRVQIPWGGRATPW